MQSHELNAGDYTLRFSPALGGSILELQWAGTDILRAGRGASIFDVGCFALVPFSNRIAHGTFACGERRVTIAPNFPGSDHPHPLHGFGWLSPWEVVSIGPASACLHHAYPGGEWPWPYHAVQTFDLDPDGVTMTLALTNLGDQDMPAGLGFHPYFPRDADTRLVAMHTGEWQNDSACLPRHLIHHDTPIDWWHGRPVGTRIVDTAYAGRAGDLAIQWPQRGLALRLSPTAELAFTVVYVPAGEDYFCVEPVSHMTDAVNRREAQSGLRMLAPGASLQVGLRLAASRL